MCAAAGRAAAPLLAGGGTLLQALGAEGDPRDDARLEVRGRQVLGVDVVELLPEAAHLLAPDQRAVTGLGDRQVVLAGVGTAAGELLGGPTQGALREPPQGAHRRGRGVLGHGEVALQGRLVAAVVEDHGPLVPLAGLQLRIGLPEDGAGLGVGRAVGVGGDGEAGDADGDLPVEQRPHQRAPARGLPVGGDLPAHLGQGAGLRCHRGGGLGRAAAGGQRAGGQAGGQQVAGQERVATDAVHAVLLRT